MLNRRISTVSRHWMLEALWPYRAFSVIVKTSRWSFASLSRVRSSHSEVSEQMATMVSVSVASVTSEWCHVGTRGHVCCCHVPPPPPASSPWEPWCYFKMLHFNFTYNILSWTWAKRKRCPGGKTRTWNHFVFTQICDWHEFLTEFIQDSLQLWTWLDSTAEIIGMDSESRTC